MTQPKWADELMRCVADLEGRSKLPKVKWIKRNRLYTSGVYYRHSKRITMCVGNAGDEKQVLLHELAHWLTRGRGHHKRFWLKCFSLLKHFGLLTEEYKNREFKYMKKASYTFNLMEGGAQ